MTFIKLDQADLDSPHRELSNGGLKSVVTLLVRWQINFLSAQTLLRCLGSLAICF